MARRIRYLAGESVDNDGRKGIGRMTDPIGPNPIVERTAAAMQAELQSYEDDSAMNNWKMKKVFSNKYLDEYTPVELWPKERVALLAGIAGLEQGDIQNGRNGI